MAETTVYDQCGPRIIDVRNSCDGSLTKADIQGFTPKTLVDLGGIATDEAALYRQHMNALVTGVRENSLYDLMLSRHKNMKGKITKTKIDGSSSYFKPYIERYQEDFINANAFVISGGVEDPAAGTTVSGVYHPAHAWNLTVAGNAENDANGNPITFYTEIKNIQRYFLIGEYVIVMNLDGSGAVTQPYFEVIDAVSANADGTSATVTVVPNVTESGWASLTTPQKNAYKPTRGIVQCGVNSVSDYESWCENQPVDFSKRLVAYWTQNSRFTRCWSDEYKKFLDQIFAGKVNPYLQHFRELPMAKQNAYMYAIYQKKMMNAFFFGEQINENQTIEGYRSLPQVKDPRNAREFLEYKSNALGVRTQLRECNRVIDLQGADLNMNDVEALIFTLKRYREVRGGTVESVDVQTDKATAGRLRTLFAHYYKARYGISWEKQMQPTEKIKYGQQTMWYYNSYELEDAQVVLNVIAEPFFNDFKSNFQTTAANGLQTRGNFMFFLDWQDIDFGIIGTNSRTSKTPNLETDPDFKCIIEANITTTEMESTNWAPIVNDPKRSLIIENFGNGCPTYSYEDCASTA